MAFMEAENGEKTVDREVILKVGEEEVQIGFVSDFLSPRYRHNETFGELVFDRIREAIDSLDSDGFETEPIIITVQ